MIDAGRFLDFLGIGKGKWMARGVIGSVKVERVELWWCGELSMTVNMPSADGTLRGADHVI